GGQALERRAPGERGGWVARKGGIAHGIKAWTGVSAATTLGGTVRPAGIGLRRGRANPARIPVMASLPAPCQSSQGPQPLPPACVRARAQRAGWFRRRDAGDSGAP